MTDLDLTQLRKIAENAMPRPYRIDIWHGDTTIHAQPHDGFTNPVVAFVDGASPRNLTFVAAACNSFDALLDRITELETENERLRIGKAAIKNRTTKMLKALTTRINESGRERERWYQRAMDWSRRAYTAEATIQRVRDVHKPVTHHLLAKYCQCGQTIPCCTIQALEGDPE